MKRAPGSAFRIGTRGSDVALRRARVVLDALRDAGVECELSIVKSAGEKKLDEPVTSPFLSGRFTVELEAALRSGKVDCCVVALDEVPVAPADGVEIVAVLTRDDPRDVLVVNDRIAIETLDDLPRGSRVAAFSVRRRAQLLHVRSDVDLVELRGDAATRLRKVDEGQAHAGIFSAESLMRLGVHQRIDAWLEPPDWLPAPAQGAVAVLSRAGDAAARAHLSPLDHLPTRVATAAERAFLGALADGAQVPIAALALGVGDRLTLHGLVSDVRGHRVLRGESAVDENAPATSGTRLALELLDRGAGDLLTALRKVDRVPTPQPE
ncbi:MAG: hydroxymethylbilane synthase [Gemmatimonadaceae bacterium]